tara:strand:- start:3205 stop:4320 length:1116 start_codon:yes stop_codon:yes gene_type:complete
MYSRIFTVGFFLLVLSCEPFVSDFEQEIMGADIYESKNISLVEPTSKPKVVTWNIRFGSKRLPWFGDSCGDDVIMKKKDVESNLLEIASAINEINPDIVLLQEVDIFSKRSGYTNQIQYLLDNTNMNYGCYASIWKADFVPTSGLGKINMGNAILSKYNLKEAERIGLALRTDQSDLVKYFYLRRNILKVKIDDLGLYAVNIHATAFATDRTKQIHIDKYLEVLSKISDGGYRFVTGGDLNSLPPGASKYDFCDFDGCDSERFHIFDEKGEETHKEASYFDNFTGELEILEPLYLRYASAIDVDVMNSPDHFTHAPSTSEERWGIKYDRKLDYLFANGPGGWISDSARTHQELWRLSDHTPVSGILILSED